MFNTLGIVCWSRPRAQRHSPQSQLHHVCIRYSDMRPTNCNLRALAKHWDTAVLLPLVSRTRPHAEHFNYSPLSQKLVYALFFVAKFEFMHFLSSGKFSTQKSALRKVFNFSASGCLFGPLFATLGPAGYNRLIPF